MRRTLRLTVLLLAACAFAAPAQAEVYTWTDASGRMHMADDLSKVPAEYRRQASKSRRDEIARPKSWSQLEENRGVATPAARRKSASAGRGRVHLLSVEQAGAELAVWAELDGGMRAPFIVDTGAMINTIPQWVVDEMGITIDDNTPSMYVRGISGQPMFVHVVTLGSVSIGGAEVEDVEMAVLGTQRRGLLGMPFFNHFKVSTDPARGLLRLEEIDLNAVEGVYGGQNEGAWRKDFRFILNQIATVERRQKSIPSHFPEAHEQLEERLEYWERQLDDLETKASQAGVPAAWRE